MLTPKQILGDVQEISLENARAIITKVTCNKMAWGHAGTEVSTRSARHTPMDPYYVAYVCTLDLSLEL
jgi:hypothetical protein